jgi:rod shape determining protein RodA
VTTQFFDTTSSLNAKYTAIKKTFIWSWLKRVDILLLLAVLMLSVIGLIIVYSATKNYYPLEPTYFLKRQLLYVIIGIIAMSITASIDYRRLEYLAYPIYGLGVLLLLAVFAFHSQISTTYSGPSASAQRWIPLGPIQLQPSEISVIGVICAIAWYVQSHGTNLKLRSVAFILILAAIPMLLIIKQPDLGTGVVLGVVMSALLVAGGTRLRILLVLAAIAGLVAFFAIHDHLINSYQLQRLTSFFNPNNASSASKYQLTQTENAIGVGGVRGSGLFKGSLVNLDYIPELYADTIFAAIGEQLGFIGSIFVVAMYALLAVRIVHAAKVSKDIMGKLLCVGVLAFIVFSAFQNIGMDIGLMPITGIPLPFISYGGSAIIAFFAAIGLVLNVTYRNTSVKSSRYV